jgi:hypothetical protein
MLMTLSALKETQIHTDRQFLNLFAICPIEIDDEKLDA